MNTIINKYNNRRKRHLFTQLNKCIFYVNYQKCNLMAYYQMSIYLTTQHFIKTAYYAVIYYFALQQAVCNAAKYIFKILTLDFLYYFLMMRRLRITHMKIFKITILNDSSLILTYLQHHMILLKGYNLIGYSYSSLLKIKKEVKKIKIFYKNYNIFLIPILNVFYRSISKLILLWGHLQVQIKNFVFNHLLLLLLFSC